jgi:hypothetical protein
MGIGEQQRHFIRSIERELSLPSFRVSIPPSSTPVPKSVPCSSWRSAIDKRIGRSTQNSEVVVVEMTNVEVLECAMAGLRSHSREPCQTVGGVCEERGLVENGLEGFGLGVVYVYLYVAGGNGLGTRFLDLAGRRLGALSGPDGPVCSRSPFSRSGTRGVGGEPRRGWRWKDVFGRRCNGRHRRRGFCELVRRCARVQGLGFW